MRTALVALVLAAGSVAAGCGEDGALDAATDGGEDADGGPSVSEDEFCAMNPFDGGRPIVVDGGAGDADAMDAAPMDAGAMDAGAGDASMDVDASAGDAAGDASAMDAAAMDAAAMDAAAMDAAAMDAAAMDAAPVDGGPPPIGAAERRRMIEGLVVLYDFEEGGGDRVLDVSEVGAPMDLVVGEPLAVSAVPGGLSVDTSTEISSAGPAIKLFDALTATNALTIEAWIAPANLELDGPSRIVTFSADSSVRNFTLGQSDSAIDVRLRTTLSDENGHPSTTAARCSLRAELVHVVFTREPVDGITRLYVDGAQVGAALIGGDFGVWDESMRFGLANELSSDDRTWLGEYHLVAIYDRALGEREILELYRAGAI